MDNRKYIEEVIKFWFGYIPHKNFGVYELSAALKKYPYWYGKAFPLFNADKKLTKRFSHLVQQARDGDLEGWKDSPSGRLALLLLLDQFPRNIFRGSERAFESDSSALEIAKKAIELGDHNNVNSLVKTFYFFPLMHQEDILLQDECVELCKKNIVDSNILNVCNVTGVFVSSLRHRYIIKRFGRYPHRNKALGRETTSEEAAFLKMPFSSF